MSRVVLLLATALFAATSATQKLLDCDKFSAGLKFVPSDAVGTWHMVHLHRQPAGSTSAHCLQISEVNQQEQKYLETYLGKHVQAKWQHVNLKMQIPCGHHDRSYVYYLETTDLNGSYMTLQVPNNNDNLDTADYNQHPMRLKIVEDNYLAMMDCRELFVFLLAKDKNAEKDIDLELMKKLESYLPAEN